MSTKRVAKPKIQPAAGVNEAPIDGRNSSPAFFTEAPDAVKMEAPERHVNGVPVSEIPERLRGLIGYEMTDEGIAEKNARRVDSQGRPHSGVQVLVNEGFDQKILQRSQAQEPWETADPLLDAVERVKKPGFRYRGLSPTVIRKKGMRGWETETENGAPVTVGNMIVAKMPIERADKRNKHFRELGNANAADAAGRYNETHERAVRDGEGEGIRVLRPGELLRDDGDPNRRRSIGVSSSRGDQGADAAA